MNSTKTNLKVLNSIRKAKYIRVSCTEQNSSRQLKNTSDLKLYEDKISGLISFKERPSGKRLMKDIENGKINYVIIHSVDRLGRNVIEMQNI
jgi:DNA invertase Pin-like site-specific DNA recombinase